MEMDMPNWVGKSEPMGKNSPLCCTKKWQWIKTADSLKGSGGTVFFSGYIPIRH